MAHALKRILFTMVHDKHTAFILVARNPDSPPDLCHCHIFMAESQIEVPLPTHVVFFLQYVSEIDTT